MFFFYGTFGKILSKFYWPSCRYEHARVILKVEIWIWFNWIRHQCGYNVYPFTKRHLLYPRLFFFFIVYSHNFIKCMSLFLYSLKFCAKLRQIKITILAVIISLRAYFYKGMFKVLINPTLNIVAVDIFIFIFNNIFTYIFFMAKWSSQLQFPPNWLFVLVQKTNSF